MRKILLAILAQCLLQMGFSQTKPAYVIFDAKGKKVSYEKMMNSIRKADMLLFGELHNNPICHWLQLEVTKELGQTRQLILGAEMFEADNQAPLNQYLTGEIDAKGLDSLARLWKNYKTDYAPLVDFAKQNKIPFIATNIPRKYANLVYKEGLEALDALSAQEKAWIAPLPIEYDGELPGYKNIKAMAQGHGGDNLPKSQAIKDATMGYFMMKNYQPGKLFIHYNGTYHSENYEGILWYLKRKNNSLNYITISTVSQDNLDKLLIENKGKADFIICVDQDMTTTY
ncbi:MAG: ChaN family lipoprotein [Saprospiraceae bacterium]|nr:ChaN family lipoprotein [Saprospiraceae bacterium]